MLLFSDEKKREIYVPICIWELFLFCQRNAFLINRIFFWISFDRITGLSAFVFLLLERILSLRAQFVVKFAIHFPPIILFPAFNPLQYLLECLCFQVLQVVVLKSWL